jgi:flagellar basal-body rod protein FlgC
MKNMFDTLDIGASALLAQRARMDAIAGNVANINTTRNEKGQAIPYRRRIAMFQAGTTDGKPGVHVSSIDEDPSPFQKRYEPGNKDADKDGYVSYPNIDLSIEYVNMLEASRAYDANITMMDTAKQMLNSSLRIIA